MNIHTFPKPSRISEILSHSDPKEEEEANDSALFTRNLAWRKSFKAALDSGKSTSIVVGANHLLGKTGVLNYFAEQGYTIEHVNEPEADDDAFASTESSGYSKNEL